MGHCEMGRELAPPDGGGYGKSGVALRSPPQFVTPADDGGYALSTWLTAALMRFMKSG